jgi:spiro-SPASM protein
MRNIALVNGIDLRPQAHRPLIDGRSSLSLALEFARSLPGVTDAVVLLSKPVDLPDGFRPVIRPAWTVADLMEEMSAAAEGHDHLFYSFADCPFLDPGLTARMLDTHVRYWADYTFADGYPAGVSVEILTRETVKRLRSMADGAAAPRRDTLFTILKKDINSFDVETEISSHDMRLLRLSLTADSARNFLLLTRIAAAGIRDAEAACAFLREQPEQHRTLPAFYPVQIVERCPQACSYCPYPRFGGDILKKNGSMPVESFSRLARKIADFSGDAVVDISLWGEPSLHPRIEDIVSAALQVPGIELVIETSGIGWPSGAVSRIEAASQASGQKRPRWIVSLDAFSEAVYRNLRGEGFAEANRTAEELLRLCPDRTWVQAVRMKENEEDLDGFYRAWKARTDNVIIQKYDSHGGVLPDRAVADLSPLKRFPCWHLKRDMAILLDGTVPLCKEDLGVSVCLGNALQDDLAVIWESAREVFRSHLSGSYPGICAVCDEYYTFNF